MGQREKQANVFGSSPWFCLCVCVLACRPNIPVCYTRPLKTITTLKLMRIAKKTPKQRKQRSVRQKRGSRWSIRGWRLGGTEGGCARLISKPAFSVFLANSQHKNQFHRKLNVHTEIEGIGSHCHRPNLKLICTQRELDVYTSVSVGVFMCAQWLSPLIGLFAPACVSPAPLWSPAA